jgi:mono/diheme cytochrome c family protein
MRGLLLVLICSFVMLPAWADGFTDYSGRELFMRFCASCHGPLGSGDGPVSGAVAKQIPDLTRLARRQPDSQINVDQLREIIEGLAVVVAHGTRYMPVWGYEFWVEEGADRDAEDEVDEIIDRLIEYLRSIQR